MEQYYTINEVAEMLKISRRTVEQYIRCGKIKAIVLGRVYRISESEVGRWVKREAYVPIV